MKITNPLVPAFASPLLARVALGVGICAIALSPVILPQTASAQTAPGTPGSALPDASRQNERDTFSGGFGNGDFSLFNLIHQSQLGTINMDEYSREINRNLSSEADKFKQQQLQMLGKPQQQLPTNADTNLNQDNQKDK
jgi:hypothetical protein